MSLREIVAPTPASEKSTYFDAPIANFHMSTPDAQDINKPTIMPQPAQPNGELATVVAADTTPDNVATEQHAVPEEQRTITPQPEPIHMHPNGSEGWLPAADADADDTPLSPRIGSILRKNPANSRPASRAASLRSRTSTSRPGSMGGASVGKKSVFTNSDGRAVAGSTFINGAGTTGPDASAEADESLHQRAATADSVLTPKQKSKIAKAEVKDGRRLSKVIKQEGKVERQAMVVAIKELSELQKVQKEAVNRESKAHTAHSKTVSNFQKVEAAFLAARAKMEIAQAQLNAEAETLDIARSNAREATEAMQEKSQEVDALRTMFGVDAREREVKLVQLNGKKSRGGWFS